MNQNKQNFINKLNYYLFVPITPSKRLNIYLFAKQKFEPCMDDEDWKRKKASLKILKAHSTQSTNLKRKQTIINRLKSLSNENFILLLADLEHENLNKFHTEIVNNLLLNPLIQNPQIKIFKNVFLEIRKVVEIIYLFSFDNLFFSYLTTTLKKIYSQNWALSCIFIETFVLNTKIKKLQTSQSIESVTMTLIKHLKDNTIGLMLYTLESFDIEHSFYLDPIQNEIKKANLDTIEALKKCTEILGISNDIKLDRQYISVIIPLEGEFDFYEESKVTDKSILPKFSASLLKNIEKKNYDTQMLDYIGQNIFDRPDLISKLLKKKKKLDFIPSLARILSKCYKNKRNFIDSILENNNTEADLILIAECSKFNIISPDELFNLLYNFLDQNQIDKLCTILYFAGRFILFKKETNLRAIELFEKIKSSSMDETSKIAATHCISVILNPKCSKLDILDFFRWFFNSTNFENSELFHEIIKNSKKFLLILFAQPDIFEDKTKLLKAITKSNMLTTMKNFYLDSIEKLQMQHKAFTLEYIHTLGLMIKKSEDQEKILNFILNLSIEESFKYKIAIIIADYFNSDVRLNFLPIFRERTGISREFERLFFNFCEKYHYDIHLEEDSFERELQGMYDSD